MQISSNAKHPVLAYTILYNRKSAATRTCTVQGRDIRTVTITFGNFPFPLKYVSRIVGKGIEGLSNAPIHLF